MNSSAPSNDLSESLALLLITLRKLKAVIAAPAIPSENLFPRLSAAIEKLSQTKAARPIKDGDEYLKQWEELLTERRNTLEPRAIRALCWTSGVATHQLFQDFLDRSDATLTAQSLQGLVRSCHLRWSKEFAPSEVVRRIRRRLEQYAGRNRLLLRWQPSASMILGLDAVDLVAKKLLSEEFNLDGFLTEWGLSGEPSQFVQLAVETSALRCIDQLKTSLSHKNFLFDDLIPWSGWTPAGIKKVIQGLILYPIRQDTELIDSIITIVRNDPRFGDPRHFHTQVNWIGMDNAKRRMQEWLSAANISFFFEHVLPRGEDRHGRKDFWLRYVGCRGLVARPLLSNPDRRRLDYVLRKKGAQDSDFGRLLDDDTSAFALDFGEVLIIEFSAVGNACYVYDKRESKKIVPDVWTTVPFSKMNLKRKSAIATRKPVTHDAQGRWRDDMEKFLASHGIRAVS